MQCRRQHGLAVGQMRAAQVRVRRAEKVHGQQHADARHGDEQQQAKHGVREREEKGRVDAELFARDRVRLVGAPGRGQPLAEARATGRLDERLAVAAWTRSDFMGTE